jgi:hypothetical protein
LEAVQDDKNDGARKGKKVNFSLVAKNSGRYSWSFPFNNPGEVKLMKSVGRIVQNGLNK